MKNESLEGIGLREVICAATELAMVTSNCLYYSKLPVTI